LNGSTAPNLPSYSVGDLLVIYFEGVLSGSFLLTGWTEQNTALGGQFLSRVADGTEGSTLSGSVFNPATSGGGDHCVATSWTPDATREIESFIVFNSDRSHGPDREITGTTSFGGDPHVALFASGTGASFGGTPSPSPVADDGFVYFADVGDEPASFSYDWTFGPVVNTGDIIAAFAMFLAEVFTSCNLTPTPNPSTPGASVHFEADIFASGFTGTITGTVEFFIDGVSQGTVSVSGGSASIDLTFGSPGSYLVEADYSGDGDLLSPTSCTVEQVVSEEFQGYWGVHAGTP
jgi:hypothetical protein